MSKSKENCGFRHIYRRNHKQKLHFLYSVKQGKMALVLLTFCCEFTGKIERYSPNRFLRLSHHKSKKQYIRLFKLSLFFHIRKWEHCLTFFILPFVTSALELELELEILHLTYHKFQSYQTWHSGELGLGIPPNKSRDLRQSSHMTNAKTYILTFTRP